MSESIVKRLGRQGVLRLCKYCGKPLDTDHHAARRHPECHRKHRLIYQRDRKRRRPKGVDGRHFNTGGRVHHSLDELLDNARRLIGWVTVEKPKEWFRLDDIKQADVCDDWIFRSNNYRWRDMMQRLAEAGLIEVRIINEYKCIKGFEDV